MIENELKYVLSPQPGLAERLAAPWKLVEQGYLDEHSRVRRFLPFGDPAEAQHIFSFKKRQSDGTSLEVETPIADELFTRLWPLCRRRLRKRRHVLFDDPVQWDVDFFLSGDAVVFVMAEAEMPVGMDAPPRIPEPIRTAIVHAVPRHRTKGFSSRDLCDPKHMRQLSKRLNLPTVFAA